MLGDILGLGILQHEGAHDLFLRLFRVEGRHQLLDGPEVGFTGEDDQRVGPDVGGHLDGVLERFTAHLLVQRREILHQIFRVDVFQWEHADRHVLGLFRVEDCDQSFDFRQFRFGRGHDEPVGGLVRPDSNLLRARLRPATGSGLGRGGWRSRAGARR